MTSTATTSKLAKRGPGRPRKTLPTPPLKKLGIVDSPTDPANRMELVYETPTMLKSLFAYFKALDANNIHIRCSPDGITLFTRDSDVKGKGRNKVFSSGNCRIVAKIPGGSMNQYYCEGTFWIGLMRPSVEKIFSSIDKSFFKITFLSRHDNSENLEMILKDPTIDKECIYRIRVITPEPDEDLYTAEKLLDAAALKMYPVEFQLTTKQLKKTVTDASNNNSSTITFEKLGTNPLQLTYQKTGLRYNEVYRTPEKIKLRSDVEEGTVFRCSVSLAAIKPLGSATATDNVRILCSEDQDILFRSEIDALIMSTFVKIVD